MKIPQLLFRILLALFLQTTNVCAAPTLSRQMIDRVRWCAAKASDRWTGVGSFKAENLPFIGSLSENERSVLASIFYLSKDHQGLNEILKNYRGPREQLITLLNWIKTQLEKPALTNENPTRFFKGETLKQIADTWEVLRKAGWTFRVKPTLSLKGDTSTVSVNQKYLQINLGANVHPMSVALAIVELSNSDLVGKNNLKVNEWLSRQLGLGESSQDTYVWNIANKLIPVPYAIGSRYEARKNSDLRTKYLNFFIERDSIIQTLNYYRKLIEEYPEFRSAYWDRLLFYNGEAITMITENLLSSSKYKGLDPEKVGQFGPLTVENIVIAAGGLATDKSAAIEKRSSPPPPLIWITAQDVFEGTPEILRLMSTTYITNLENIGGNLTDGDIRDLKRYLQTQEISSDPGAASERINWNRLSGERRLSTKERQQIEHAKDFVFNIRLAILLLREYDKNNPRSVLVRNWSGAELGIALLSRLQPNIKYHNYSGIFSEVLQSALDTTAMRPQIPSKLVDVLDSTPAIQGFLELPFEVGFSAGQGMNLFASIILHDRIKAPGLWPDSNKLFKLMHEYIFFHLGIAKNSPRIDPAYIHTHITWAKNMIYLGQTYFTEREDSRADYFKSISELVETYSHPRK